eukprot:XP_011678175.1 PREDICTED: uncharacterized protein LOC592260 [Strongylocentrotus purpuratus]
MNATALYVSTCRYILQADFENGESWGDLYRLLPYLRQSLSCCVCGSLLNDPLGPTDSNCQHFVCRTCVGGKMLLKPTCSWCKNYEKFAEVRQLRILLSCYKKLCEYIAATPIARSFIGANGESNSTLTILEEGMAINAVHESSSAGQDKNLNILDILARVNSEKTGDANSKSPGRRRGRPRRDRDGLGASPNPHLFGNPEVPSHGLYSPLDGLCNGIDSSDHLDMTSSDHSIYSASFSPSGSPRIKIKRKRHSNEQKDKIKKKKKKHDKIKVKERKLIKEQAKRTTDRKARSERKKKRHRYRKESEDSTFDYEKEKLVNGDGVSSSPEEDLEPLEDTPPKKKKSVITSVVISGHRAKLLKMGRSLPVIEGCRCGTWGKSPGANTCKGNRCPCFMTEKGCLRCKCRGCRNPFIVPESPSPKPKRYRHSSRNEVNGESELDIDVTNM